MACLAQACGNTVKLMMMTERKASGLRLVRNVVLIEAAALLSLVVIVWLYQALSAPSAFWGGMVFLVPNAYFTFYAFRYSEAQSTLNVALSLHRGQIGKLILVAVGFALVFRFVEPLHVWPLFLGYLYMLAVHIAVAAKVSARISHMHADAKRDTKA